MRRHMCDVAAHLGLSDLNIDDDGHDKVSRERQQQQQQPQQKGDPARAGKDEDATTRSGFLKIPERLRPRPTGVRAALSPEQTALFRLEGAGRECLGVLADLKGGGQHAPDTETEATGSGRRFLWGGDRPTSLDCLAFGYLALMLVPEVARPWLRNMMRRRYDCLCVFVDGVRDEVFGGDVASLPWTTAAAEIKSPWRVTRFARGVVKAVVPGDWVLGETYWALGKRSTGGALLATLGSSVAGLGIVGSVLLYHHLSPFGAVFYRWEMQRRSFGAAGALFGV